jgi:hypothetical protein
MEQVRKGVTQNEIARSCGVGIRTIRRWIRAQVFPERRIAKRRSKVDKHREYLEQRWNKGCHNATQLWHELRARGFAGQSPIRQALGSEPLWLTTTPHPAANATFFTAAFVSTANSLEPTKGARRVPQLHRGTMSPVAGDCNLRWCGAGVRPHDSATGRGRLAQLEGQRKKQLAGKFCKTPLSR